MQSLQRRLPNRESCSCMHSWCSLLRPQMVRSLLQSLRTSSGSSECSVQSESNPAIYSRALRVSHSWRRSPSSSNSSSSSGGSRGRNNLMTIAARSVSTFSLINLQAYRLRSQFQWWGLEEKEVVITNAKGTTKIHIWVPNRTMVADYPKRPALLMIHGFGANALWTWNMQLPDLATKFDVYIPDLVFFGGSTSSSLERTDVFQAHCMAETMAKLGVPTYDIASISYGGLVAYRMAYLYPAAVRKVVLTGSPGPVMLREDYEKMLSRHEVNCIADLLLPSTTEGVKKLMTVAYVRQYPYPSFILRDVLQNLMNDMVKEKEELLDELVKLLEAPLDVPKLEQETLLIWGEKDAVFPLSTASKLQTFLAPKAKLMVIKDAAHMPNGEHPQVYNRLVLDFLMSSGERDARGSVPEV